LATVPIKETIVDTIISLSLSAHLPTINSWDETSLYYAPEIVNASCMHKERSDPYSSVTI